MNMYTEASGAGAAALALHERPPRHMETPQRQITRNARRVCGHIERRTMAGAGRLPAVPHVMTTVRVAIQSRGAVVVPCLERDRPQCAQDRYGNRYKLLMCKAFTSLRLVQGCLM